MENQEVRDQMIVFDEFSLLISRVLGDHAISTERDSLHELIEPFTFVGGRLNRAAKLGVGKITQQENRPDYSAQFSDAKVELVLT